MFNTRVSKLFRKIKEVEGNRKSINKLQQETSNWNKYKKLIDKDHKLYQIWYRRTGKLSSLLGIKVNTH